MITFKNRNELLQKKNNDYTLAKMAHKFLTGKLKVRFAEAKPEDIREILRLETLTFVPQGSSTLDPPETYEGIERFLTSGGEILLTLDGEGFLEKIPLENLLRIEYGNLSASSPLRQVAQNRGLLDRAKSAYSQTGKEMWYVHGVGTIPEEDGSRTPRNAYTAVKQLMIAVNGQKTAGNKVHFGYIDIGPKIENINVNSFGLFMKLGAVIDGYETEVYQKGVPYLRVSHGVNYKLSQDDEKIVDLSKRTYKREIRKALEAGYIGTQIAFDGQTKSYSLVFYKVLK